MKLTLREEWMEPDYTPSSLYEAPFYETSTCPRFADVMKTRNSPPWEGSLESFADALLLEIDCQLALRDDPIHLCLSGGYDSRILACLLERAGRDPLYITDGMEEPSCSDILEILGVPEERRYRHPMDAPDPYGITDATCDGFAPLYVMHRFMPGDPDATIASGLGGGEWFSYPASNWLNGHVRRLPGDDVVAMWLDCWPQYTLIPDAWAVGYKDSWHPYCTLGYARIASRCHHEWLQETVGNPPLDLVRGAMLELLNRRLLEPPWTRHNYPWNLSDEQKDKVDSRFFDSWVSEYHQPEFGLPSQMDEANHACTLAGFATWVDKLTAEGCKIVKP